MMFKRGFRSQSRNDKAITLPGGNINKITQDEISDNLELTDYEYDRKKNDILSSIAHTGSLSRVMPDICDIIRSNRELAFDKIPFRYDEKTIEYDVRILPPVENTVDFPSIVMIPSENGKTININKNVIFESNNCESTVLEDRVDQAAQTAMDLARISIDNPAVIIVPVIPSESFENGVPYWQQLSPDCFDSDKINNSTCKINRLDNQVLALIDNARNIAREKYGTQTDDKIFLNGYSASGTFAQRFALLHPDRVRSACIGGASFEIPSLDTDLEYPLGVKNIENFDIKSYEKINFDYYVAELENIVSSYDRIAYDVENQPHACMYDMTYMERSIPRESGEIYRSRYGYDLFVSDTEPGRVQSCMDKLSQQGINISHTIINDCTHNGVTGLYAKGEYHKFVKSAYDEACNRKSNERQMEILKDAEEITRNIKIDNINKEVSISLN